jgi:hypothetical protein
LPFFTTARELAWASATAAYFEPMLRATLIVGVVATLNGPTVNASRTTSGSGCSSRSSGPATHS